MKNAATLETSSATQRPLISVIMPYYNSEQYVAQAVDSILQQDFINFEILAIDDGSSDTSRNHVQKYADKDPRVRNLVNLREKGASGARNTGLDAACGEWVTFLDSDDKLNERSLSSRVDFLTRNPACRVMASDYSEIDEMGEIITRNRFASVGLLKLAYERAVPIEGGFCLEHPVEFFFDHNVPMWTGSVMLHASVIKQTGHFDPNLSPAEDKKYWYLAALHHELYFSDRVTAYYRKYGSSMTTDVDRRLGNAVSLYRELSIDPRFSAYRTKAKRKLSGMLNNNSYNYRERKKFLLAAFFAVKSILTIPGNSKAWRNLLASFLRIS